MTGPAEHPVELVPPFPAFGNVPGTPMVLDFGDGCRDQSPRGFSCGGRLLHIGPHVAYDEPGRGDPCQEILSIWFDVMTRPGGDR